MDLRLSLHDLASQHKLTPDAARRLLQLAKLDAEPQGLRSHIARGVAIAGAALAGLGIVMWVAANWESLGRAGRFALLESFVLVMCIGAIMLPVARAALSLLAFLAIGGLFAYFGQTYQTGADAWQLFALWAVLSAPLCGAVRSDALWAPWALVAMGAISLWVHAMSGNAWRAASPDLALHLIAWSIALLLTFVLSPIAARYTGAGIWALRTSVLLTILLVMAPAIIGIFDDKVAPQYWLGLIALLGAAVFFAAPNSFDIFGLSAVGLALDILVVAGITHLLFNGGNGEKVGSLLIVGMLAAGVLALTVSVIMWLARTYTSKGSAA